jgi:hypothetical protein
MFRRWRYKAGRNYQRMGSGPVIIGKVEIQSKLPGIIASRFLHIPTPVPDGNVAGASNTGYAGIADYRVGLAVVRRHDVACGI